MVNSFRMGKPGNIARVHRGILYYGSKLRRSGIYVATSYASTYGNHPGRPILEWTPQLEGEVRKAVAASLQRAGKRALEKSTDKASKAR